MKTTGVGPFLAVTILAGLLTASFAIAAKDGRAKALMQAAHQKQLVDRNEAAIKAPARLAAPGQPAGPSNGSTMIALVSVADGSLRVLKTLPATDPQKVSRLTVLAGMPDWIWCMLHFCKRSG
jgi:hypothetical protein